MMGAKEQAPRLLAGCFWFLLSPNRNLMPCFFNASPGTTTHWVDRAQHQEGTLEAAAFHVLQDVPPSWLWLFFPSIVLKLELTELCH